MVLCWRVAKTLRISFMNLFTAEEKVVKSMRPSSYSSLRYSWTFREKFYKYDVNLDFTDHHFFCPFALL